MQVNSNIQPNASIAAAQPKASIAAAQPKASIAAAQPKAYKPNVNVLRPVNGRPTVRTNGAAQLKNGRLYSQFDRTIDFRVVQAIEETVLVQEILHALAANNMGQIKRDFLSGKNAAPRLTPIDYDVLNSFNQLIRCGRPFETLEQFLKNLDKMDVTRQNANFHLTKLLEGKNELPKDTPISCSYTYQHGKEVLRRIISSGYFTRLQSYYSSVEKRIDVKLGQETVIDIKDELMPTINDSLSTNIDY